MGTVLYVTAEALRAVGILAQPFMPNAAGSLLDQLAVAHDARQFRRIGPGSRLVAGQALPAPAAIFPRFVEPVA